jgi:predicted AAA+ superfamily ATPase
VVGGSWQGFVIEQLLAHLDKTDASYWRTRTGAEFDLPLFPRGRRIGVEIERAEAPKMTDIADAVRGRVGSTASKKECSARFPEPRRRA